MKLIEKEITQIEKDINLNGKNFCNLNHPKGFSGVRIARLYLTVCIAFPVTFIGSLMTFGFAWGIVFCVLFGLASLYIELVQKENKNS